jgi:hypothetical protein
MPLSCTFVGWDKQSWNAKYEGVCRLHNVLNSSRYLMVEKRKFSNLLECAILGNYMLLMQKVCLRFEKLAW